ncbi:MAG TPA: cell wall hydrolase [Steroidobacteraceae bacterium]|nr:cell wall hydrolase [Steroidobacteraceae bacterium]
MRTSLLYEVRIWPVLWRRRLGFLWKYGAHGQLMFVALLALLIAGAVGGIYFACANGVSFEPLRLEALQRQELRAQRRADDLRCLAENVYFEARGEPLDGQYAVAEVTLNRTRAQHFPHTVCAVVHEMRWDPVRRRHIADFSWTELGPVTPADGPAWKQAMTVASTVYDDLHPTVVPHALYYHATSVRPDWARSRREIATIGNHIFYR